MDVGTQDFEFPDSFAKCYTGACDLALPRENVAGDVVDLITEPWNRGFAQRLRSSHGLRPRLVEVPQLQFQTRYEQLSVDGLRLQSGL